MVQRLQVIFERLTADRNALFNHQRGFDGTEGVALNRVRRIGNLEIVVVFEVSERLLRQGPQCLELPFPSGDEVRSSSSTLKEYHAADAGYCCCCCSTGFTFRHRPGAVVESSAGGCVAGVAVEGEAKTGSRAAAWAGPRN